MKKNKEFIFFSCIVVGVLGYMAVSKISEIYESYENDFYLPVFKFEKGKYREALVGDDTFKGFYSIINDYKGWKDVSLPELYAAICLIKLKDYENGIEYLNRIKLGDPFMETRKHIFLGDTYADLNKYTEAIIHYQKATTFYENDTDNVDALYKIILCYKKLQKYNEALNLIKDTMEKYPNMTRYKDFKKIKTHLEILEQNKK